MNPITEDTALEISSHVFPKENTDDHHGDIVYYTLPLPKRHHLPIKVLKYTMHIQNIHVLCRQHWFV
jgi:hypothetical protein